MMTSWPPPFTHTSKDFISGPTYPSIIIKIESALPYYKLVLRMSRLEECQPKLRLIGNTFLRIKSIDEDILEQVKEREGKT
jgi:hypothetical protein